MGYGQPESRHFGRIWCLPSVSVYAQCPLAHRLPLGSARFRFCSHRAYSSVPWAALGGRALEHDV
jgi:hypothetical protein